jgi:hypothetical protein
MRKIVLPSVALLIAVLAVPVTKAFFNELEKLKQELVTWETTHASDFSDILNTLDDLSGPSFDDVTSADWFSPYVASVSDWGIVSGYSDANGQPLRRFGPSNPVTVAELLKMTMEAAQIKEEECGVVPPLNTQALTHWAVKYISCAEIKGVRIVEEPNIDFNRPAKRAEVIAVLHDAFGDRVPPLFSNFKDTIGHPLEADIAYAYSRKIISGDKDALGIQTGTFRPNESINRAEVAKIIYERLKVDVNEEAESGL